MKLALAVALLVGCQGAADPAPCSTASGLRLAYSGSDDGREAAAEAIVEWQDTCHVDVCLDAPGVPLVETAEGIEVGQGGVTRYEGGRLAWIHLRPRRHAALFAHEIGHALGILEHTPGADDLMTGGAVSPDAHVTAADCAALPVR